MIVTGTSGFSFRDWKGVFYPNNIKSSDWLGFYAEHFNTLEINATYYAVPKASVFENMVKRTSEGFEFVVKANKASTHEYADRDICVFFKESIMPLKEAGRLSGILFQFPWNFRNEEKNRIYLSNIAKCYEGDSIFIEFRHDSWNSEGIYGFLKSNNLYLVSVDEPQLKNMMPPVAVATGDRAYIRFHGRNIQNWWGNGGDRYDYNYNENEMEEWVSKVEALEKTVWKIYAFFNNCHKGYAVRNAMAFMEMSRKRGLC